MSWKDKNFDAAYFKEPSPVSSTQDITDVDLINVLDTEIHDVKSLQQDAYCKHIHNTLHTQT